MRRRGARPAVRTVALAALLVAGAAPRAAQAQVPREPWSFYVLPFPTYNSLEGLGVELIGGWWKSAPPGPIPVGATISPNASISASGTRTLGLTYNNEGRVPGWRFLAQVGYERFERAPYFGLGNASVVNDSLEAANGGESHYYRYSLTRATALAAVERQVAGPLRIHLGAQYRRYRALPLTGDPTALGADLAAGATSDTGSATSLEIRGAILLDTRDEEASPSRGVFLEMIGARALKGPLGGAFDYTRWAFGAREFVPVGRETVLALRQSVQLARGHLPFYIAYERLTHWLPEDGFGGATTLRENTPGRWLGPNTALAGVDVRYKYWDGAIGSSPFRLWLLLHADAGRVWEQSQRFQWRDLHSGYGVGAVLQLGKASLFGIDVGWSPDAHFQFSTVTTLGY